MKSTDADGRALAILSFHKIGRPRTGAPPTWFYVPEDTFLRQLTWLRAHRWQAIDAATLLRGLEGPGSLPRRAALLTFDDGYRSMRTVALPLLRRLGFPAVLFVLTGHIGGRNRFGSGREPDEPMCDWDDLRELERGGVSIQSHGVTHRRFSLLDLEQQRAELLDSKATLERGLDKPVELFAFPYGDGGADPAALEKAFGEAGYRAACSYPGGLVPLPAATPYRLPRLAMGPDTDLATVLEGGNSISPLPTERIPNAPSIQTPVRREDDPWQERRPEAASRPLAEGLAGGKIASRPERK